MTFLIVVYIVADFVNKTAFRLLRGSHDAFGMNPSPKANRERRS